MRVELNQLGTRTAAAHCSLLPFSNHNYFNANLREITSVLMKAGQFHPHTHRNLLANAVDTRLPRFYRYHLAGLYGLFTTSYSATSNNTNNVKEL